MNLLTRRKKLIINALIFALSCFVIWQLLQYSFSKTLFFSFHSDDWIILWGLSQQNSIFFNPFNIDFHGTSSIVARDGLFKIWYLNALLQKFGLDPYAFHYAALISYLLACLSLVWCGWKLTGRIYVGVFAGMLFSTTFLGSQSLYWIHNSVNYLLIAGIGLATPLFIANINQHYPKFILSLLAMLLAIFIHPARAHGVLALPIIALLWQKNIFNKTTIFRSIITIILILMFYKILTLGISNTENFNLTFGRLIAFSTHGINDLHWSAFLSYPLLSISVFSLPVEVWYGLPKWNSVAQLIVEFTLIWTVAVNFIYRLSEKKNFRSSIIYLILGFIWLTAHFAIRTYLILPPDWEWQIQFTLLISGLILLFTIQSFLALRNHPIWGSFVKALVTFLILIISTYIISWMFDPLFHPNSNYSIGRYFTLPSAFGSLYLATILGWIMAVAIQNVSQNRHFETYLKSLLIISSVIGVLIYSLNLKATQTRGEMDSLLTIKSNRNITNILETISKEVIWGYPPPALILSANKWDYGEVFGIFLWNGHALALKNNIHDFVKFPIILFIDEDKVSSEVDKYCNKYKPDPVNFYRFDIEKDTAINLTDKYLKLECSKLNPQLTQ